MSSYIIHMRLALENEYEWDRRKCQWENISVYGLLVYVCLGKNEMVLNQDSVYISCIYGVLFYCETEDSNKAFFCSIYERVGFFFSSGLLWQLVKQNWTTIF